jgi:hypothetical protein
VVVLSQNNFNHQSAGMSSEATSKNNLQISNPTIAREWHPAKNGSLTPKDVTTYSSRKVWWLCEKGHVWLAAVSERVRGNTCPHCSGKKEDPQKSEQVFDPSLMKEWHPAKNESLKVWWLCSKGHEWSATVNERIQGVTCPYCSGKELKDEKLAQAPPCPTKEELRPRKDVSKSADADSIRKVGPENCLRTVNPNLAKEWHPTKNGSLTPSDVTVNSNNQVWWLCAKGHEWKAAVSSRNKGQGCFYCSYMQKRKRP